jgi:hypothetical protein
MIDKKKVNNLMTRGRIENVSYKVINEETRILYVRASRRESSEIFVFVARKASPFCRVRGMSDRQQGLSEAEVEVFLSARPFFPWLDVGCSVFDTGKAMIC